MDPIPLIMASKPLRNDLKTSLMIAIPTLPFLEALQVLQEGGTIFLVPKERISLRTEAPLSTGSRVKDPAQRARPSGPQAPRGTPLRPDDGAVIHKARAD